MTNYRKKKRIRICKRIKGFALLLLLLGVITFISMEVANAYNCSLSTGSLSRGMQPMPDYFQCPHTNGNRVKVPVCDSNCNCYWVTQCDE